MAFRARDQAPRPEGSTRPHRRRRGRTRTNPGKSSPHAGRSPLSSFTGDNYEGHQQGSSRGVTSADPGGVGTAGGHGPGPVRFYSATAQPHRGAARNEGAGAWRLRPAFQQVARGQQRICGRRAWRPRDRRAHQWSDGRADSDRRAAGNQQTHPLRSQHQLPWRPHVRELRFPPGNIDRRSAEDRREHAKF